MLSDLMLTCRECGKEFSFTASQQAAHARGASRTSQLDARTAGPTDERREPPPVAPLKVVPDSNTSKLGFGH